MKSGASILLGRGLEFVGTTFYLVRHAIKEKSIGDVSITPEGRLQAQSTARHFCNIPIVSLVTSPLQRAKETAEIIALETKSIVNEDIRLRERANWGDLPEQTLAEFVEMWERCTRDPYFLPPVGDSVKQASERFTALLSEVGEKYPTGSSIIFVTHGGLITDFLVSTFPESQLNKWHPDFLATQSELVSECSITEIIYDKGNLSLKMFASVKHLEAECY